MMEKLAQAGKGGGARPTPFTISTITNKVVVYTQAEREDPLHQLFLLYPIRTLWLNPKQNDIILNSWDGVRGGGQQSEDGYIKADIISRLKFQRSPQTGTPIF
jgi:hypothetical protein